MTRTINTEFRDRKIEESRRPFDPIIARAELLNRNPLFLSELSKFINPARGGFLEAASAPSSAWEDFCSKWRIQIPWNPDRDKLERFVYLGELICRRQMDQVYPVRWPPGPELRQYTIQFVPKKSKDQHLDLEYAARKSAIEAMKISEKKRARLLATADLEAAFRSGGAASRPDRRGDNWEEIVSREDAFIYLRINPWTTPKDLEWMWPEVRHQKRKVYGYEWKEREKKSFFRHLCWYDLYQEKKSGVKVSYQIIAQGWRRWGGAGPCSLRSVQKAIGKMGELIERASIF